MNKEREVFEESNNIKPDWSFKFDNELQQYVELDHEMQAQVEEFNEHWDTFRAGWEAAKAQAVSEGYVLVPKEPTEKMIDAGHDFCKNNIVTPSGFYKAMIEAQEPAND